MGRLAAEGDRMFAGRDHLHTAAYHFVSEARADGGSSAATALDHPFAGLAMIAVEPGRGGALADARRRAAMSASPRCSHATV